MLWSVDLLGCNCAIAATRFRSIPGGSSNFCSQPIRGLEGGEMRNSLSGSGGRRNFSDVPPRKTIGYGESGVFNRTRLSLDLRRQNRL